MAYLRDKARQYGAAQGVILVASTDFVELCNPGEDSRRHHVGAPRNVGPNGIFLQPALHQIACRVARCTARGRQVGNPVESMPGREPLRTRRRGRPARRGMADKLAGELDFAAGDRRAACRIARPSLADSDLQITWHPADQSVTIE